MQAAEVNNTPFEKSFTLTQGPEIVHDDALDSLKELLSKTQRKICLPLWTVWMSFGFTYYGVILFGMC
jgi:hypothetical protein